MAANTVSSKDKTMSSTSNAYTLPLSCHICLGKVRQPALCSNFHVFCGTCINTWLQGSDRCPSCRVLIDHTNPVRHIRGGLSPTEDEDREKSTPQLRKMRFDLLYRDYEDSLDQLDREVKRLRCENASLKSQLAASQGGGDGSSNKGPGVGGGGNREQQQLQLLTYKLQDAQKLYEQVKQDIAKLKKENHSLRDANAKLTLENTRQREEISSRSPQKFGRLTVATLEAQLEQQKKEVQRLNKALERSDHYIETLQQKMDRGLPNFTNPRPLFEPHEPLDHNLDSRIINGVSSSDGKTFLLHAKSLSGGDVHSSSSISDSGSSVKRQLFSSSSQFGSADGIGMPNSADSAGQTGTSSSLSSVESRLSDRFSGLASGSKPVSGLKLDSGSDLEDVVGSIMRKSDLTIIKNSTVGSKRERSPKKVHFNLKEEKKLNDSSSFSLEVPSPILHSSSSGDYSMTTNKPPLGPQGSSDLFLKTGVQRSSHGTTPDWVERIDDDGDSISSPQKQTNDLSTRRKPPAYTLKEEAVSGLLSQRHNHRGGRSRQRDPDSNSNLSEPEYSTPSSLDEHASDKSLPSGRSGTLSRERRMGDRRHGPSLSFNMDEPSLDDTQTIQTELKDLDISVTPELSDCLKLLNRAERKVSHAEEMPGLMTQARPTMVSGNSAACVTSYSTANTLHTGSQQGRLYSISDDVTTPGILHTAVPRQYLPSHQEPSQRQLAESDRASLGKGSVHLGAESVTNYPLPNTSSYCSTSGYSNSTSSYSNSTSRHPSTSGYASTSSGYPSISGSSRDYAGGVLGVPMSSWEHGFFSSLRVNPYKHSTLHGSRSTTNPPSRQQDGGFEVLSSQSDDFKSLSVPSRRSDLSFSRSSPSVSGMGSRSSSLTDVRRSEFSHTSSIPSSSRLPPPGVHSKITRSFSSEQLSDLSSTKSYGIGKPYTSLGRFSDSTASGLLPDRPRSVDPVSSYHLNIPVSSSQPGLYGGYSGMSAGLLLERPRSVDLALSYPLNIPGAASLSSGQQGLYGSQSYGVSSATHRSEASTPSLSSGEDVVMKDRRTPSNYSYLSNGSSQGDSHHEDSFLPEPKKRLFGPLSEEDSDLGTPSKATRML